MIERAQPWANIFRPKTIGEIVDNERAVRQFLDWVKSWEQGVPEKRAAFLYGPPGVGKTSCVSVVACELGYDLLEINASDYRTGKRLDALIGRSAAQGFTVLGRRRMILLDELEGISGREDEGGISAIAHIIKETRSPIALVATSASEGWEEKFSPLREVSLLIEFSSIPFEDVLRKLVTIADEVKVSVDDEVLERISERSIGDLRSAINDLEAVARGKDHVGIDDVEWLGERDRSSYTPESLMKIFSAKTVNEARRVVGSSYLGYDDLFEWIYENIPLVLDDVGDLVRGLDALSRADIHEARAKKTDFRLLKYMFNEMTGGVALSRRMSEGAGVVKGVRSKMRFFGIPQNAFTVNEGPKGVVVKPVRYLGDDWRRVNSAMRELGGIWEREGGFWTLPFFRPPQRVWRFRRTWHSRRMRDSVAERLATKCHISRKEAVREVIPLLRVIIRSSDMMSDEIAGWLRLDEKEFEWLKSR